MAYRCATPPWRHSWLHFRHCEVAAFAAGGMRHVHGILAVCAGSCGPGNLHLIMVCSTPPAALPVVAIAAHISFAEMARAISRKPSGQLFRECSS